MAATAAGPSSGTASLLFGAGPTTSIDVEVPLGLPAIDPNAAPYVDPQAATFTANNNTTSTVAGAIAKTVVGVKFAIPA